MKRKRKTGLLLLSLFIAVSLAGCSMDDSNKDKEDLKSYYSITQNNQCAIVMGNTITEELGIIKDSKVYLPVDVVNEYLNKKFYYDSVENIMLYTNSTQTMKVVPETTVFTLGDSSTDAGYTISTVVEGQLYINIEFVQKYTNMEYNLVTNPNRVVITYQYNIPSQYAELSKDAAIRVNKSRYDNILEDGSQGQKVIVIGEDNGWQKVRTQSGLIGYIESDSLDEIKTETLSREFKEEVYKSISKDYKIALAWHQMIYEGGNSSFEEKTANAKINTISPTWFTLDGNNGEIKSIADASYVKKAHNKGWEVWALIDDFSKDEAGNLYVSSVLSSTTTRQKLVSNIMSEILDNDIDGINIDFEKISKANVKNYLQFLRELSVECRKNEIVLSVDNYVPTASNSYYDREEQGQIADYVIVMGYDEHWAGCGSAGSNASLPFVTSGVKDTVAEVDSKKVINAMPFYTRVWIETPEAMAEEGSTIIEDSVYGNYALSSKTVGMTAASEMLSSHGVTPTWDQSIGQYYGQYESEGKTYRVWVEDTKSIGEKMKLVSEYNLGGIAAWKLGLQDDAVWNVISEGLK